MNKAALSFAVAAMACLLAGCLSAKDIQNDIVNPLEKIEKFLKANPNLSKAQIADNCKWMLPSIKKIDPDLSKMWDFMQDKLMYSTYSTTLTQHRRGECTVTPTMPAPSVLDAPNLMMGGLTYCYPN